MDEQANNDNQPTNAMLEKLTQWSAKASEILLRWMQRLFVLLQKLWGRWQAINWPDIPLTAIQWVLLFYAIFGSMFLLATPIFEASDELWHFGMVEYITENAFSLPEIDVSDPELIFENNRDTIYRQEGSQPPLYYLLSALILSPIDISDAEQYRELNPHAILGNASNFGNKNHVLHEVGRPPLSGTPLAVYVLRVLGLIMGGVTVFAVYHCGKLISPQRPVVGLVAAAFTAFNPMFLFISASVNNDTLVIMLNSLAIWLALMTMREGFDLKRSLAIAVLIALASLTKLSALVLIPVIALGALWVARRKKDWQGLVTLGVAMVVVWGAIAGWWYLRNINLYGELFGTSTMAQVAGIREDPFTIGTAFSEFQGFRLSYWGVFGAFNIQMTGVLSIFYPLADFIIFLSMFGVVFLVAQLLAVQDFSFARRELTLLLFLLGIQVVAMIAFFNWTRQTNATQGRLLFPFLAALSPLLAVGLVEVVWWILFLLSPPDRSFVRAGEAVPETVLNRSMRWPVYFIGFFALLIPFTTIAPKYRAPSPIDAIPTEINRVDADYGDIRLIGYEAVDRRYRPGEAVRVTFYWEVEEQSDEDLSVGITLLGPRGERLGGVDSYPGSGTLRTSTWEEGKIYADTYQIPLSFAIAESYPFGVQVNWYEDIPEDVLPVTTSDGDAITDVVLGVGAVVNTGVSPSTTNFTPVEQLRVDEEGETLISQADRDFGGQILINSFNVDPRSFSIDILWETRSAITEDYTMFLHVLNSDSELVGQADVFPNLPTHYWRFGEMYVTSHHIQFFEGDLDLALGDYTVVVGLYINDGETYPRLPILSTNEEEDERDFFQLMTFEKVENRIYVWPSYEEPQEGDVEPDAEATEDAGRTIRIDLDEPEETETFMEDFFDVTEEATSEADVDITEESVATEAIADVTDEPDMDITEESVATAAPETDEAAAETPTEESGG
ncbi:MAG: DUF2142 domain-containing protein [Anaerolineae bacterium]|nr:DUF2142 domain-containing protein [Anaerolineae bacterium]